eukprot:4742770-Pyramimonas_sp.AAC.1
MQVCASCGHTQLGNFAQSYKTTTTYNTFIEAHQLMLGYSYYFSACDEDLQSALDTRSDTLLQQVEARLLAVPLSAPVQQRTPALAVQIADPQTLAPVPTPGIPLCTCATVHGRDTVRH